MLEDTGGNVGEMPIFTRTENIKFFPIQKS